MARRHIFGVLLLTLFTSGFAYGVDRADPRLLDPLVSRLGAVLVLGALLGLLLGLALLTARGRTSDRIGTAARFTDATGLTVLATLPRALPDGPRLTPPAEAVRAVRAKLLARMPDDGRDGAAVVLVTSARPGEGRSTVAASLAVALARAGRSVVLVDADLTAPMSGTDQRAQFRLDQQDGLADVLADRAPLDETLAGTAAPRLRVLPAGQVTDADADLLDGPAFGAVIRALRRLTDVVIVDAPTLLGAGRALGPAGRADHVLLTADLRRGLRADVSRAVTELTAVTGADLSAVLVDGLPRRNRDEPRAADPFALLSGPADETEQAATAVPVTTVYASRSADHQAAA